MNISSIKNRADELLIHCKPQVIRIMTIMLLVGLIPSLFNGSENTFISLISLVLTIVFLTFSHGYIVTTLKVVSFRVGFVCCCIYFTFHYDVLFNYVLWKCFF